MTSPTSPRSGPLVVIKLGGSLMSDRVRLGKLLATIAAASARPVIVPGGGVFADAVRTAQAQLGFSDALAHRLALDAMSAYAEVLLELNPDLQIAQTPKAITTAHRGGQAAVWIPTALRSGHASIPESWAITSDSLSAWLSAEIAANSLLLIKSADIPAASPPTAAPTETTDLIAAGILDLGFPAFLDAVSGIVRILGPREDARLSEVMAAPEADIGLRLKPGRSEQAGSQHRP